MTDELAPLTSGELDRLAQCEQTIERGLQTFYEVGSALMTIKEARLYRQEYQTFEVYCRERWGMGSSRARQLIGATNVVDELQSVTRVTLPSNEAQVRALNKVPEAYRVVVWEQVVAQYGSGATSRQIATVAHDLVAPASGATAPPTSTTEPTDPPAPSTTDPTAPQTVIDHCVLPDEPPPFLQPQQDATPVTRLRITSTDEAEAQEITDLLTRLGCLMEISLQPSTREKYQGSWIGYFTPDLERLRSAVKDVDDMPIIVQNVIDYCQKAIDADREADAARAALEAERQRADGLENEADQLGNERNEALDERDALRQQLAQARATETTPWVPQTPDEALDTDGLLVELVKVLGTEPTSLLALVKRLTTSREMLSHSLARCAHLWERLGLVLGDATPGTGGRGLWVPMEGSVGYTFGSIRREERADLHVPMADSDSNGAGHGGRPPDTSLRDRVRVLLAEHPDWTQQQIADAAGCGISLVKAVKARRK